MLRFLTVLCSLCAMHAAAAERLPAYILQVPSTVRDVFIAETDSASLYHFEQHDGELNLAGKSYMSIGEHGVGKQRAWDRKTPLGIYFVVDRLDTSGLHEKYGAMAFPLDYPNVYDRLHGLTGDGIWVHGVQRGGGPRPERDTDGCLALPNDTLTALQADFVPLLTPVIVTRSVAWHAKGNSQTELRDELRAAVQRWSEAYGEVDLDAYFSLYAEDFSYRDLQRHEWRAFREQSLAARGAASIAIDELLLLADPEVDGLFLSRFEQRIHGKGIRLATTKRLYWRRNASGALRIVAEDNG
jgi:murein L,D-transpeptidase YafK